MTFAHRLKHSYDHSPIAWRVGGGVVLTAFVILSLISAGYYPIVFVNGSPVWARQFQATYQWTAFYYANMKKVAATQTSTPVIATNLSDKDLEVGVLNSMIAEKLISEGAVREIGRDLDGMVNDKLALYENDLQLQSGARTLYGMGFADFRRQVLVPQTRTDLLSGRLFLRNISLSDWLEDALKKANVIILSSAFQWDGQKIVAR